MAIDKKVDLVLVEKIGPLASFGGFVGASHDLLGFSCIWWRPAVLDLLPHPAFEAVQLLFGSAQRLWRQRSLRSVLHAEPRQHSKAVPHRPSRLFQSVRLERIAAHL